MENKTPEEVHLVLASALKIDGLTHAAAAERLGMKKQTFSNIMSSKTYLTPKMAERFNQAFGYSRVFLMSGEGELFDKEEPAKVPVPAPETQRIEFAQGKRPVSTTKELEGDIELILDWVYEAALRMDNKDLEKLWGHMTRFAKIRSIVANQLRNYTGPDYEQEFERLRKCYEDDTRKDIVKDLDNMV